MKIGAGGLQAIFAQDAAKGLEANRVKTTAEVAVLQSEDPVVRKQLYDLNKAVERMRRAAEAFNQPLDFEVKRGDKPKIKSKDRRTGVIQELTLEEAEAWLEGLTEKIGKNINGYA